MTMQYLLAAIAVIIIIVLAFYAGILLSRIKYYQEQEKQKQSQRNTEICESIHIIARATMQKQCNLSEAAIRLIVLLEILHVDAAKEYPALLELFNKIKEMPTHDKRKAVPVIELKKLDKQRHLYETELEEKIIKEAAKLTDFSG